MKTRHEPVGHRVFRQPLSGVMSGQTVRIYRRLGVRTTPFRGNEIREDAPAEATRPPSICVNLKSPFEAIGSDPGLVVQPNTGLRPQTSEDSAPKHSELVLSRPPARRPSWGRAGRGAGLTIHLAAQLRRSSRRQDPESRLDRLD